MTHSQSGEYVILRAPKGWGKSLIFHCHICYLPNPYYIFAKLTWPYRWFNSTKISTDSYCRRFSGSPAFLDESGNSENTAPARLMEQTYWDGITRQNERPVYPFIIKLFHSMFRNKMEVKKKKWKLMVYQTSWSSSLSALLPSSNTSFPFCLSYWIHYINGTRCWRVAAQSSTSLSTCSIAPQTSNSSGVLRTGETFLLVWP